MQYILFIQKYIFSIIIIIAGVMKMFSNQHKIKVILHFTIFQSIHSFLLLNNSKVMKNIHILNLISFSNLLSD